MVGFFVDEKAQSRDAHLQERLCLNILSSGGDRKGVIEGIFGYERIFQFMRPRKSGAKVHFYIFNIIDGGACSVFVKLLIHQSEHEGKMTCFYCWNDLLYSAFKPVISLADKRQA